MQELVRWELEPLLMQHTIIWSVGRILVGLGYLEETQAREILARQQGKQSKSNQNEAANKLEMYSLKRFGDVAIEQGYITREQLDEALTKQAWLRMEGDDIACGWQAIAIEADAQGPYPWLASGVNKGLLKQWEAAFSAQRITLEHFFPVAGCAAANLSRNEPAIVLETGGGQVVGMRLGAKGLESIVTHESALNGAMEACLETYHGLTPPDPESLWLAIGDGGDAGLPKALSDVVGREARLLKSGVTGIAEAVTSGMAGAARHVLALSGGNHCCAVLTRGPKASITSTPKFRLVAGAALIFAGLLLAEGILQVRQSMANTTAERVNKQAGELDAAVNRVQALIKQQDDIKAKRAEVKKAEQRADFYTEELPRRATMVRTLLDTLERTANDSVVLERIAEEQKKGMQVTAWALSDTAAQQFALSLKRGLEPLGLALVEMRVTEKNGRLSLPGYAVTFRIVDKDVAATLSKTPPAGVKK
jgi:hypothetical protein